MAMFTMMLELRPSDFLHHEAKDGRVARIERVLAEVVRPGETVQPLDWTAGTLHAMLRREIRIATPFLYDYHFYHHVETAAIKGLRERFLNAMTANPPAVIVEVRGDLKPQVSGVGTTTDFPELNQILSTKYVVIYDESDFRILRRSS